MGAALGEGRLRIERRQKGRGVRGQRGDRRHVQPRGPSQLWQPLLIGGTGAELLLRGHGRGATTILRTGGTVLEGVGGLRPFGVRRVVRHAGVGRLGGPGGDTLWAGVATDGDGGAWLRVAGDRDDAAPVAGVCRRLCGGTRSAAPLASHHHVSRAAASCPSLVGKPRVKPKYAVLDACTSLSSSDTPQRKWHRALGAVTKKGHVNIPNGSMLALFILALVSTHLVPRPSTETWTCLTR